MAGELNLYELQIIEKFLTSETYIDTVVKLVCKKELPASIATKLESTRRDILMKIAPDKYNKWSDCCETWVCCCERDLEIPFDSSCPCCNEWRCSCDGSSMYHKKDELKCKTCSRSQPRPMLLLESEDD